MRSYYSHWEQWVWSRHGYSLLQLGMKKPTVTVVPTTDLLKRFHPENPKEHDQDTDVQFIAQSLLEIGWATTLTLQENGSLLGGHGRVLAADWLRSQSQEWFDHQFKKWCSKPGRSAIELLHKQRFCPEYWENCPVWTLTLDETTQKSTLIRLNNTQRDGKDNPERLAALLAKLPREQKEHAGWDEEAANKFMASFRARQSELDDDDEDEDEDGDEDEDELNISLPSAEIEDDDDFDEEEEDAIDVDSEVVDDDKDESEEEFDDEEESDDELDEEESEEEYPDEDPEVGEGGVHFNEDPPPGTKREMTYPLAICLSFRQWKKWKEWKESIGVSRDLQGFLKGHEAFAKEDK